LNLGPSKYEAGVYILVAGKPERKRTLRRNRRRWDDNIKVELTEIWGWGSVAGSCEDGNENSGFIKGSKLLNS
jgi:hypothetical protein